MICAPACRAALVAMFCVLAAATAAKADLIGHGGMVRSIDISPDGQRVITGSFDYTARVWTFGEQTEIAVLDQHQGPVTSVRFGPGGKRALTTSDDFSAILWDMQTFKPLQNLVGHKHKVMTATFAPDGKHAATGAWDHTVRIWDLAGGKTLQTIDTASPVNAVVFYDGGRAIASGGHGPMIELWDAASAAPLGKLEGHLMGITALRLSPDGRYLLSASIDKTIKLWDLPTRSLVRSIDVRDGQVFDVAFSPDGGRALTAGKDGYLVEWDLSTGAPLHEVFAHDRIAWATAYSPDGRFAASASSDEQVRIWHLETGDRIGLTAPTGGEPQPWLTSDHPGAKLYTKCANCHSLTAEGPARSGPHFEGLFGRPAGSVAGYRYSGALTGVDFRWDERSLFRLFSEGPDKMLPGTKMPVQRVPDDTQLSALVDYLRVLTAKPE